MDDVSEASRENRSGAAPNGPDAARPDMARDPAALSDPELLQHVARKDALASGALEHLFLRHSGPLLRFLSRLLRDSHAAEDLLHDVFIRVTEAAGTFRGGSSARTWLFAMGLNQVRSRQRRAALENRTSEQMKRGCPQTVQHRPEDDPVQRAQNKELRDQIDLAIADLNEGERETFLLYWFGQMSYHEISETTGLTVAAAKVRVHRALTRLSRRLEGLR